MRLRTIATVGVAGTLLTLGACTAGGEDAAVSGGEPAVDQGDGGGGEDAAQPAPGEPAEDGARDAPRAGGDSGAVLQRTGGEIAEGRHIIRRAEIELVVSDPEGTADAVTGAVERVGGFVSEAELSRPTDDQPLSGFLVVRVPAERLSATLTELEGFAEEVRSKSLTTEDVTGEVTDLEARLRNLRALETELRGLLAEAREQRDATPDQLANLFDRVSEVRGEIERLEGRRATLAELVDLATIRVELTATPDAATIAGEDDGWAPLDTLRAAGDATAAGARWIADAVIWVGVFGIPLALVLALPVAGAWLGIRLLRRRTTPV